MREQDAVRVYVLMVIFLPISIVCELSGKGIEESVWERQSDYKQGGDDCVSDFILLQDLVFYNNSQNRFKILETFAPVNRDLPLAVFLTYHENSTSNRTDHEITPGVHFDQVDCAEAQQGTWFGCGKLVCSERYPGYSKFAFSKAPCAHVVSQGRKDIGFVQSDLP